MLAAVGGLVDTALVVGAVRVPKRADVNRACILRIDNNTADLPGVTQADVLPALAAVRGAVQSVAGSKVRSNVGFPGADVNDFRSGGSDGNCADRSNGLMVEDRRPGYAGVRGFPDAAIDCTEVKRIGIAGNSCCGDGAASAEGTDEAPLEAAEEIGRDRLGAQRRKSEAKKNQKWSRESANFV